MKSNISSPRTFRGFPALALALAALGLSQPAARAASITWGSAQDDTDLASDVKVNGVFVDAATTWTTADVALNGVTFKRNTGNSGNVYSFTGSSIQITYPSGNSSFTGNGGSTDYQKLRSKTSYTSGGSGSITLGGLTSGQQYQVQVWAPDWNGGPYGTVYDGQVTLLARNYGGGQHSQYAVGTFTADGTTQVIPFAAGSPGGYCMTPTAVSLRDVSVADPTITATGSPLSAMSTTYGTASTATSFSVSGTNMTAGITVTPPAGLEVSTDSATTGFAGSGTALTVGSSGTIDSSTVWVRLAATAAIGTYNSQNIVLSSSGAPSVNVTTAATGNNVIGGSTKLVITSSAVSTVAGVTSDSITVQRQNDSGTPITDEASITVALSSDSTGTVTFTPSTLTIDNGSSSASFTYTDTKAGTPTLTAELSPLTPATQMETVTPDTASQLAFGTQPTTTTAGTGISPAVTVLVKDQYGNTVTTDNSRSVAIGSSTTDFTVGSTLTADTVDGVATFSAIQPTTAGSKTLTASDGSLTDATSNAFTVNGAAATQLVFTSTPVSTPAGIASGNITVQRQDQYNNPTTIEANRTVTLTSDSSGTVTFTPASPLTIANGSSSASFTYTDTSVGTPILTAASTSPDSITSAEQTETITAAPATITWGAATDDTDLDSDVLVNGTFVDAVTTYGSDVTLNGVTFQHYSSHTGSGPYSLAFGTSAISMTYPAFDLNFTQNPASTDYEKLLHNSMYADHGSGTITLSNLTPGTQYQVQVWAPDWNGPVSNVFDNQVTILGRNYSQSQQSQYAVGTFTANSSTQVIHFVAGATGGYYSFAPTAVSLRDLTGGGGSTYADWASTNGAGTQTMAADHDNDGVSNGVEYFLGGNTDTTGFTALPGVVNTAGTLSVTWTKAAGYPGAYGDAADYVVETSTTLAADSWTPEPETGGDVTVSGNNVIYTFPSGPVKFARLKVMGTP